MQCRLTINRRPTSIFDPYIVTIARDGASHLNVIRSEWELTEFLRQIGYSSLAAGAVAAALREPYSKIEHEIVLEDATWRLLIGKDNGATLNAPQEPFA